VKDHGALERQPLLEGKSMSIVIASTHRPKAQPAVTPASSPAVGAETTVPAEMPAEAPAASPARAGE
jgi:hypothetical protein